MARPLVSSIDEVVASFPGAVMSPWPRLNGLAGGHAEVTEGGVVPVAAGAAGHAVELDHGVSGQSTLTVVCDGDTLTLVPWALAPGAGEVAVDPDRGWLRFHASRGGETFEATYRPWGSVRTAGWEMRLEAELAAAQAAIQAGNVLTVGPAGSGAQYATVQDALDAIPAIGEGREAGEWAVVRILPGRYLTTARFGGIHVFKDWISFEGTNRDLCLIEKARVDADGGTGEFVGVDPFAVDASHIRISGLTIRNIASNWPGIGLALTINPYGGKGVPGAPGVTHTLREDIVVRDCNLVSVGGRDTVFVLHKVDNFLMEDCYIEGSSDIVSLCSGTMRNCHVHCIEASAQAALWCEQGWYEGAYRDEIVVERCTFTGVAGVIAANLTRGVTTLIDCVVHGAASYLYNTYGVVGVPRTLRTRGCTAAGFMGPSNAGATVAVEELKTSGASTLSAALTGYIPKSTLTAKGSILTATAGSAPAELPVPSTAGPWILRPASGAATGLEWIQRGVVYVNTADSTEIANHTTATAYSVSYTFPANTLVVGAVYRVVTAGVYSCAVNAGFTLFGKLGGKDVFWSGQQNVFAGHANQPWRCECLVAVRSTGATGTIMPTNAVCQSLGTAPPYHWAGALQTIDTTAPCAVQVLLSWSVADAGTKSTLRTLLVERLA